MFVRVVAGFLQAAVGVAVAVWWRQRHPVVGPGDTAAQFIHGFAHFLYFLLATVWGWIALWLFVEGLLRVLAPAMQQPFGTAPVVRTVTRYPLSAPDGSDRTGRPPRR